MKKLIIATAMLLAIIAGWLGGQYHMRMNQIVYDEAYTEGFYYVEYAGRVDMYWYE